uniref:Reverse transcriptase domain-containing protein n=1 Tax=Anolis carolinensis TaxID=28377 RepID=A0A803SP10_ANOCA
MEIKCHSNNINGLNSPNKRNRLFNHLKKLRFDLIALQETHICHRHDALLSHKGLGVVFSSTASEKKRGVVLYISEKLNPELAFKDEDGRWVGAKIRTDNQTILICNIYAPNGPKTLFIENLKKKIDEQDYDELILLGDFNGVIDPELDKRGGGINNKAKKGRTRSGQLPTKFVKILQDWDLIDTWRAHHDERRDFTYFSNRHNIWTRIDMVWTTTPMIPKVSKINILPRYISDHCPLEFIINRKQMNYNWRLNGNLIKSEGDITKNKKILQEYFDLNNSTEVPQQIIWDASKAFMRGHFIQQNAQKNKNKNRIRANLKEEIKRNESKSKQDPNDNRAKQDLENLRKQMTSLDLEEMANKLKFLKQQHFQNANKPGKWLAWKIRKEKKARTITEINSDGIRYTTEQEIADQFNKFYSKLYSKDNIRKDKIGEFLSIQKLPKITEKQREFLNKDITEKEIQRAINNMESNKAPGPDGLNGLYYKTFAEELTPHLKKIMNEILDNKKVPDTWRYATITVIPKDGQDPRLVKNYRPISLLNSDYKIFTNILAERLKEFLADWIGEDQTGFLPRRHMRDNVREIINIIEHYEGTKKEELALLAVDMEKAFDNLNWDLIKLLIKELDMGYKFTNAINQIYDQQEAKIKINSLESKNFEIQKGTRQGCPLSPLLFIFVLELLIKNIRNDHQLKGASIRKHKYKIRAFADDLICIIEDPIKTMNIWIDKFKEFEKVSGLKINLDKTVILTKNMTNTRQNELMESTGIQVRKKIKYLGIILTAKNSQLLENNYDTKWKEIKKDLEKWRHLNLSLVGRVAAVKMTILPKMIFFFQNIPIIRNSLRFQKWNKDLSKFIWRGKKPRIKRIYLMDEKKGGG